MASSSAYLAFLACFSSFLFCNTQKQKLCDWQIHKNAFTEDSFNFQYPYRCSPITVLCTNAALCDHGLTITHQMFCSIKSSSHDTHNVLLTWDDASNQVHMIHTMYYSREMHQIKLTWYTQCTTHVRCIKSSSHDTHNVLLMWDASNQAHMIHTMYFSQEIMHQIKLTWYTQCTTHRRCIKSSSHDTHNVILTWDDVSNQANMIHAMYYSQEMHQIKLTWYTRCTTHRRCIKSSSHDTHNVLLTWDASNQAHMIHTIYYSQEMHQIKLTWYTQCTTHRRWCIKSSSHDTHNVLLTGDDASNQAHMIHTVYYSQEMMHQIKLTWYTQCTIHRGCISFCFNRWDEYGVQEEWSRGSGIGSLRGDGTHICVRSWARTTLVALRTKSQRTPLECSN